MQGNPIPTPASIGAQPANAGLQAIASLTPSAGGFLVGTGSTWSVQSGLNARSDLGGTTVGQSFFTLSNPSLISFPRINANNTVTARLASDYRGDLGLGTAATVNTGTTSGTIPVLTTGGLLAEARLPGAGIIRGWVVFDGTTTPPTIYASSGVSSVGKTSTGIWLVTLTNSAPGSGRFAVWASAQVTTNWDSVGTEPNWNSANSFSIGHTEAGVFTDSAHVSAFVVW